MEAKLQNINYYIAAGYTLFMLECSDYARCSVVLREVLPSDMGLFLWRPNLIQCEVWPRTTADAESQKARFNAEHLATNEMQLLDMMEPAGDKVNNRATLPTRSVIFASLFDVATQRPDICARMIYNVTENRWHAFQRYLVLFTPISRLDPRLDTYVTRLELPHPNAEDISRLVAEMREQFRSGLMHVRDRARREKLAHSHLLSDDAKMGEVCANLRGMSRFDIENTLGLVCATTDRQTPTPEILDAVNEARMVAIRKSDILTYLPPELRVKPKHVGGFERFLEFMQEKAAAFSPEAAKLGIDRPKGVVLLGIPGTGKSMAAKALGSIMKLPTVVMDMSSVFGSLVGESERRVRQALKTVDSLKGCVLLIDEADKALAGGNSSQSGDSGTTQRVLGTILTWLQEQRSNTFVVITMNRPSAVPPEFLRPGRFDKIFYTDLPTPDERKTILLAHLDMRGVSDFRMTGAEWDALLESTTDFTGAELEEVVKEAQLATFIQSRTNVPTAALLLDKAAQRVPMAKFDQERIQEIRAFCENRAVPVSRAHDTLTQRNADSGYRRVVRMD